MIFGTRPEAIKMAPLYRELSKKLYNFELRVCVTAQHRQLLDQVIEFFEIKIDYDLNLMQPGQSLSQITSGALSKLEKVLEEFLPDLVLVQGDTNTAFVGALAAYYKKIKIGHVEAGLRSWDLYSPFPEEGNRIMAGHISTFHFAPTEEARRNLSKEGIKKNVFVVKNTVIDALYMGLNIINEKGNKEYRDYFDFLDFSKRTILVTGHRRESFGRPFEQICLALRDIAKKEHEVEIVYPLHSNPNVTEPVNRLLSGYENIHIIEPLDYPKLLWLMNRSCFVITDSGGIQEEAPSLGKPVLVTREVTERMEGIKAGTAKLVGTDRKKIVRNALLLLNNKKVYNRMSKAVNPYGDGKASVRIASILKKKL